MAKRVWGAVTCVMCNFFQVSLFEIGPNLIVTVDIRHVGRKIMPYNGDHLPEAVLSQTPGH